MKITELSVRYPALAIIATVLIVLWGTHYFLTMSQREDPEITIRGCRIITAFPGALPEDIEQYVTKPLEDVIAEIGEVNEISSDSRYGLSVIFAMLEDDTPKGDVDQIWDKLRNKIDRIAGDLPEGSYPPIVDDEFFDTCSHIICVSGDDYSPRELTAFAERIQRRLSSLPAAGKVSISGDRPERIFLEYDQAQMTRYGVGFKQLLATIEGTNILMPGGGIELNGQTYAVDSTGGFERLADIENLPVYGRPGGAQVRLGDLGELRYGYEDPPEHLARVNGHECVMVSVIMKDGMNVIELGRQVEAEMASIRGSLPVDLCLTIVQDQPSQVSARVSTFLANLRSGVLLVILVVFLFMGLRPSVPVGLAIPLVMVTSFAVLNLTGTDLQQMSIAGLIIALGMLVDNAIVVTDNVSRYLDAGMERRQAAITATQELAMPMLTSTLTTVAAFLPLVMLPGETGEFIFDIPLVVSIAILMSYVLALTTTPMICSLVLRPNTGRRTFQPLAPLMRMMENAYPLMLHWTQLNLGWTALIVTALFIGSLAMFPLLGVQFFPGAERNQFAIDITLPDGSSIFETQRVTEEVEAILDDQAGVTSYLASIGAGMPMYYYNRITRSANSNLAEFLVNTESVEATARIIPDLRRTVQSSVSGARIEVKFLEQGPPVGAPIQIKVQGDNITELKRIGDQIKEILADTPHVIDVQDSFGNDRRQLQLVVDETQLRAIGSTKQDINSTTGLILRGYSVTEYRAPGRTIPMVIRARPEDRDQARDLDSYYIINNYTGSHVPLSSIAHFQTVDVTSKIQRRNRVRELVVSANMSGGRLSSDALRHDIQPALAGIKLKPGYSINISGEAEESGEAFADLGTFATIAILLIILIIVAQFKSIRIGLVVFISIPLSLIGAILGLLVTGNPFGFTAGLGVISLAGIVINNSIVLIDFIMERLRDGHPLDEAIDQAGRSRLRPILLTTVTTIGGLLPLGIFGGSMWSPLCFAIIGGLIVSTFLTLLVVPLVFRVVAGRRAVQLIAAERENGTPAGD